MSTLLMAKILLRNSPKLMILTMLMLMASSSVRSLFFALSTNKHFFVSLLLLFSDFFFVCLFQISKNRRVSVRSFGGKIMVDIREFYVKEGKQMPGRKGTYFYLSFNRILIFLLWFWYLCF